MTSTLMYSTQNLIDLFSLFVLFSQHRSPENPLGKCFFFHISSYSRANLRIIYEKTMGQVSLGPLLRACLHGVGEPGLVGLVSFVFTLWGTQNKRNLPH